MENIMIKPRMKIVKFVDKVLKDMLTIATFLISEIRISSRKQYNISFLIVLLFVFLSSYLNGQEAVLDKQILGSGGMIEQYDNSGIVMSGLVTQTAIEEIVLKVGTDSLFIYQGFWIPVDSLVSAVEPTISLSKHLNNYPNPLTNSTKIIYELSGTGIISIRIFDVLGNSVKVLFTGEQVSGLQSINWDAKDESGQIVTSGVYMLELDVKPARLSGNSTKSYKLRTIMVVVK